MFTEFYIQTPDSFSGFKWLFKYIGLEVNPKGILLVLGQTQKGTSETPKGTVPFGIGLARTLLMGVYFPRLNPGLPVFTFRLHSQ